MLNCYYSNQISFTINGSRFESSLPCTVLDHMKPFCSGLSITSSNIDDCVRMKMDDISLSGTIQIKLVISYTSKWKDIMYSLCNEIRIINF